MRVIVQRLYFRLYSKVSKWIDKEAKGSISKLDLMDLAIKNMVVKKTRALITVGGVAIGFGAIVFLVSLGYGLQELVISKVARLDELKQADISVRAGSKMKINDRIFSDIQQFTNVAEVLPLIAAVGRVSYQSSVADVAVFGVTTDYLEKSAIKPSSGKIFQSQDITFQTPDDTEVSLFNNQLGPIQITSLGVEWLPVYESPDPASTIIGYTKDLDRIAGVEVLGNVYDSTNLSSQLTDTRGDAYGKWAAANFLLWEKTACDTSVIYCENGEYLLMRDISNNQKSVRGYLTYNEIAVSESTNVLGESIVDDLFSIVQTDDPNFVEIPEETAAANVEPVKKVALASNSVREAVVNRAMLTLLGINENDAVGKTFEVSYIITSDLLENSKEKVESIPAEYKIVGVTPDDKAPIFYVPFIDLRSLGITSYSQLKVVANDTEALDGIRKQVEALGFVSSSVVDTVSQINSLFKTARVVLAIMGTVALIVAALGMFNTFTVSLLERTREVGLMKAIGMQSAEVQELFLIEAMIMGFGGGVGGVILGFLMGKSLSLLLTALSLSKGLGTIDIAYVPAGFVALILFLSLFVGAFTGLYPAKRAQRITALNALRYE